MVNRIKELLFRNRDERQTITKNIFWLSFSQVGSRLIRAVIIIYAARILGAAEYGVFSYALGLAGFFTIFSDLGITSILTREVSQKPEKKSQYFSTALAIKSVLLLGTAVLVVLIAPYFSRIEEATALIPFIALLVIFDGLREFCLGFFRGKEKMELEALVTILTNVAITTIGFVALYFAANSRGLTISYVGSVGVGALTGVIILRKEFGRIIKFFDKKLIKPLFNSAWPLTLYAIIGAFMLNTDIIMLGWWRSPEEIGYYSAGQRIIQVLYTLPAILASAIFPAISRSVGQKNNQRISLLMEKGTVAVFMIAIPLVVGGTILAKSVFNLIYGQAYLPGATAFSLLLITTILIFPGMLIGNLILACDKQRKISWYLSLAAVANIAFNAVLIPKYGIAGSAFATIVAQLINTGLSWRLGKKLNNFHTLRHLKKIIASAIIMGVFSFALNKLGINVVVNIVLSVGIYAGSLLILKEKVLTDARELLKTMKG